MQLPESGGGPGFSNEVPHEASPDDPIAPRYMWPSDIVEQVFALLIRDPMFYPRARRAVRPEYFPDRSMREIVRALTAHLEVHNQLPSEPVLRFIVRQRAGNDETRARVWLDMLERALSTSVRDPSWVRAEVVEFGRRQAMKLALGKALDLLERGDLAGIQKAVTEANLIGKTSMDPGSFLVRDYEKRVDRRAQARVGMATGFQVLDVMLDGGGRPGELYCVVAGAKQGKTFFLVNLAYHAARAGRRVVYYTLEVDGEKLGERFDCRILGMTKEQLRANPHKTKLLLGGELRTFGAGELVIKQFPSGVASVAALGDHLAALADVEGFRADELYVDYVDLLAPDDTAEKEYQGIVRNTVGLRALAMDRVLHCWTASQFTKEGSQRAVGRATDMAGAWGKVATVDGLFGLSSTEEEDAKGLQRLSPLALRNAPGGRSVLLRKDWDRARVDPVSESYAMGSGGVAGAPPHLTAVPPETRS